MSNSKSRIKQEQMHDSYIKQVSSKSVIKTIVMGRAESGPKSVKHLEKGSSVSQNHPSKKDTGPNLDLGTNEPITMKTCFH